MKGEQKSSHKVLEALGIAIQTVGTNDHVERLTDLISTLVRHDRVTVVRYSATARPEFVSHRNYSEAMVQKYLEVFYVYDPFYAYWRKHRKPGVVGLREWPETRGPYIADFLGESVISDELGVLLNDGPEWCLGIFLDRSSGRYSDLERKRLQDRFNVFAALHELDSRSRSAGFRRTAQPPAKGREPQSLATRKLRDGLWTDLSRRERELAQLILAGHPNTVIATKLGITTGTAKNHRHSIYNKLDITTERELFLQYIESISGI